VLEITRRSHQPVTSCTVYNTTKGEGTMRINLTTRHGNIPDGLKEYIETSVKKLKKYYDGIVDADVELDYEKRLQTVDFRVHVHGTILKTVAKTDNLHKSIDEAITRIEVQLKKYKGRKRNVDHAKAVDKLKHDGETE
jgi:putative sigma-54 modulation protein